MFCHCICLSESLTVQVDSEIILLSLLQAKQKKRRASLKHPHVMHAWPLAAVSCRVLYYKLRSSGHQRQHSMGMWYFLHRAQALATYFLSVKPYISCLFAGKGPQHAAVPQSFYLQTQTPGARDTNSVYAVNFTSLSFVGLVCNMGKCEINQVVTSLVLCTRRRKLEPGLTICGIIKTAFVPPWLTLFSSLFSSLLSFLLNFASPAITRLHNPSCHLSAVL